MRGKPRLEPLKDQAGNLISDNWYIVYFDGKRSRRLSTGYAIGAQDHEANLALSQFTLDREKPTSREPDKLMVAQALKDYYEEAAQFVASAVNARSHESRLNKHFMGYFVAQLTPAKIKEYVRTCDAEERSSGTTRREIAHLQAALNHEVAEQRMTYAPKLYMPEPPAPRERTVKPAEIKRLRKECAQTPHLLAFLEIMMETGQRPGAVERLTWFQVDFKKREINFHRAQRKNSKKRARIIPMSVYLYGLLKRMEKTKRDTGYVLEYVITRKDGSQSVKPAGCVRKAFERACGRAKIKGVSRYTLRHTYGDTLDRAGVDDRTISEIMGHTSVLTTRKHYLKTNMDRMREAVNTAQQQRKTGKGKK